MACVTCVAGAFDAASLVAHSGVIQSVMHVTRTKVERIRDETRRPTQIKPRVLASRRASRAVIRNTRFLPRPIATPRRCPARISERMKVALIPINLASSRVLNGGPSARRRSSSD